MHFRRNHQPRRSAANRRFRGTLEALDARVMLAADLSVLDAGLENGYFASLQASLNQQILSSPAPLIGDALAGPIDSQQQSGSQFLLGVDDRLQQVKLNASSSVSDATSEIALQLGITEDAIRVTRTNNDADIRFEISLTDSRAYQDAVALELVGADPELELLLGAEGQVDLQVDWSYEMAFGVREGANGVSTFYVDDSLENELSLGYTATVNRDFTGGKGRVGVFIADFSANQTASQFQGQYVLDVSASTSDDARLSGVLSGSGDVNLSVEGSLFPSFLPADSENLVNLAVLTDAHVQYQTAMRFAEDGSLDASSNQVTVGFENVRTDLGQIYHDFVDPMVTRLQDNLKPLKPVVDFLTEPLPVISDLYQMAGRGNVTALSLAGYGPNSAIGKTLNTIDAILDYQGLASTNQDQEPLFQFAVAKSGVDPATAVDRAEAVQNNLKKLDEGGLRFELADKHKNPAEHAQWQSSLAWNHEFNGSIDLPFLTNFESLAALLLGDTNTDLFTFQLDANFNFDATVDIPIVPLLNLASVTGRISFGLDIDLDGGYDATGIKRLTDAANFATEDSLRTSLDRQEALLLDGFYLDDHNDTNRDHQTSDSPEMTFTVELGAGLKAGIDLLLMQFELGGEVVLEGNLHFDLNDLPEPDLWSGTTPIWSNVVCHDRACNSTNAEDWTYDGRIRLHELKTIVDADPAAMFNMHGDLKAGFDATLDVSVIGIPIISERWRLLRTTLVNGNIRQPNDAKLIYGENPPILGALQDGTLTLFAGDQANRRNRENSVVNEVFTVQSLGESKQGGETVMVTLVGNEDRYSQYFHGVTRIVADGGSGHDSIRVLPGMAAPATIRGGDGDDILTYAGTGNAELAGGRGNDFITSGSGNDQISGDAGDDTLDGGSGRDRLYGGDGNDQLRGGADSDQLLGQDGDDTLHGGLGDDWLVGHLGDDVLNGGAGADFVHGHGGRDRIQFSFFGDGGAELDRMTGGAGKDTIEILGTESNDVLTATQLPDGVIQVTNDDDAMFRIRMPRAVGTLARSVSKSDAVTPIRPNRSANQLAERDIEELRISGLGGDDQITAIGRFDVNTLRLDGGDGFDILVGADSQNILIGGAGNDVLVGGTDRDILRGGDGDDALRAGDGNDVLYGEGGNDRLEGDAGADIAYGGDGHDWIEAGEGNLGEMIYGGDGNDTLLGGNGVDVIFGGAGHDEIYGFGLGDLLMGDAGNDTLVGGSGRDFLFGGSDQDQLFALEQNRVADANEETNDWRHVYNQLLDRENEIIHTEVDQVMQQLDRISRNIAAIEAVDGSDFRLPGMRAERAELEQQETALQNELAVINLTQTDVLPRQVISIDVLDGGTGDDQLTGSPWADRLNGNQGNDTIYHSNGADAVFGGDGLRDTYVVGGTDQADDISVDLVPDADGGTPRVLVDVNGSSTTASELEMEIVGVESRAGDDLIRINFGANAAMEVMVDAGAGDDVVDIGTLQAMASLDGGEGRDQIQATLFDTEANLWLTDHELRTEQLTHALANFELSELDGNALDNLLDARGFSGDVTLRGAAGNDSLWTGLGNDVVDGGEGIDTLGAVGNVNFVLSDVTLQGQGSDRFVGIERAELIGGDGNNRLDARGFTRGAVTLRGGLGNDALFGGHGDDKLYGDGGDDWLEGGANGVDFLYGGDGSDQLRGEWDHLYGENGNDYLYTIDRNSGMKNYSMYGGNGNDQLYGGANHDTLYGGSGNDQIFAGRGNDLVYGGDGVDYLYGNEGDDRLYGEAGNDQLYGHDGHDFINGGGGNDYLIGGTGRDTILGEGGNDHLDGGRDGDADTLNGGSGTDSGIQYRYWRTTFWPFGEWVNQESLASIEEVTNKDW